MRTIFLNVACILTIFDIRAPTHGKLEAKFVDDRLIRYFPVSLCLFCDPCYVVSSGYVKLVTDAFLKDANPIQVQYQASIRCQLEVDEVCVCCGSVRLLIGNSQGDKFPCL